jgi:phosphate:Na+ symporter
MIFYFGLIFFGLEIISQAAAPLKESPRFLHYFTQAKNPLIGLGVGIAATALVQASAIPIAILAVLAQQDLVRLENAVPFVWGQYRHNGKALRPGGGQHQRQKNRRLHLIFKCAAFCFAWRDCHCFN